MPTLFDYLFLCLYHRPNGTFCQQKKIFLKNLIFILLFYASIIIWACHGQFEKCGIKKDFKWSIICFPQAVRPAMRV